MRFKLIHLADSSVLFLHFHTNQLCSTQPIGCPTSSSSTAKPTAPPLTPLLLPSTTRHVPRHSRDPELLPLTVGWPPFGTFIVHRKPLLGLCRFKGCLPFSREAAIGDARLTIAVTTRSCLGCMLSLANKSWRDGSRSIVWLEGQRALDASCGVVCLVASLAGWKCTC